MLTERISEVARGDSSVHYEDLASLANLDCALEEGRIPKCGTEK